MPGRLLLCMALSLGPLVSACGDGGKIAAETAISSAQEAFDAVQMEATSALAGSIAAKKPALAASWTQLSTAKRWTDATNAFAGRQDRRRGVEE